MQSFNRCRGDGPHNSSSPGPPFSRRSPVGQWVRAPASSTGSKFGVFASAPMMIGPARSHTQRFAFGTWKIEVLGGFASAVLLLAVVALMVFGSVERLIAPQPIHYQQAMVVAAVGLIVNIVSALILGHAHHEDDHHEGDDHHHHHDLNLKSAYIHVIADAATSVLAIAALAGGWIFGWSWLDPVMGLFGAVLVAVWARQLLTETGKVLLDREMDHPVVDEIREVIEANSQTGQTRIADLHVWRVGRASYSCALSVVTRDPTLTADEVRAWLSVHEEIVHSTIEVNRN